VFGVKTGEQYPDGAPVVKSLLTSNDFKIMRHTKIRSEANLFDPEWETYFEDRLGLKMREDLKGNRKLLHLWRDQKRGCPICNQKITKETGWNVHHLLPKSEGGKDNSANLVLLHPNCHRQIHNRKLALVKPVSAKGP
jgi:RNA-directed DNA polymerase